MLPMGNEPDGTKTIVIASAAETRVLPKPIAAVVEGRDGRGVLMVPAAVPVVVVGTTVGAHAMSKAVKSTRDAIVLALVVADDLE